MVETGMVGKHMTTMEIKFLTLNVCNTNTLRLLKIQELNAKIQELKDAEQTAINKKASAKQKLKDLGLDDEELKSMGL
tara:strand:+ start:748 stop:981 length:234 start_codon:yes stop_codon:yes gene_type:complete